MREIKFRAWIEDEKRMIKSYAHVGKDGVMHTIYRDKPREYAVMQYTGLKDKSGVEIYEGDILKFENSIVGSIKWGYNGFNLTGESCITNFDVEQELEVVGNIYQTPELLEVTA